MEFNRREALIGVLVFFSTVGLGLFAGDQVFEPDQPQLYESEMNVTLHEDNEEETVEFDGNSATLYYENWNRFRAFVESETTEKRINITSDGERRTVSEVVITGNEAYTFYFRYRDDPDGYDGDFLQLYRIEQIQ